MELTMNGGFRSAEEFIEKAQWFYDHSYKPEGDKLVVLTGYDRIANGHVIDAKDAHKAIAENIKTTLETCRDSGAYERLYFTINIQDDNGEGGFHMTYTINDEIDPSQYFSLVRLVSDEEYAEYEGGVARYDIQRNIMEKEIKRDIAKREAEMKTRLAKEKAKAKAKKAKRK